MIYTRVDLGDGTETRCAVASFPDPCPAFVACSSFMYWEWGYHVCTYHAYVSGTLSSPWQPGSEVGDCVAWLVSASPGTSLSDEALLLPEVQDKCTQAQVLMSSDTTYRPIMFIEPISNLRFSCNSAKVSLVRVLSRILSLGESVCCLQGPGGMPPQKILGSLRLSSKWSVWGMQGEASLWNPSRLNCASEWNPLPHIHVLTQFTCFSHHGITDGFNTR